MSHEDVLHLENLSDPRILARFPEAERDLQRNERGDVVRYLRAYADLLEPV
jgi:hypothetical protein